MPNIDDFPHDGFGPGEDFGHSHNEGLGHSHGLFGHGGFFEPNHFERSEFFVTPSKSKGGDSKGLYKPLAYILYGGVVVLIVLITLFILFS